VIRALLDALAGKRHSGEPDKRWLAFARGLALGALVGAAIAGSSLWKRWRRAQP
jgi:hypothetical protein